MLMPMSPSDFQNALYKYVDFHRAYLFRVMFFDGVVGTLTGTLTTELISATSTPTSATEPISLGWQGSKVKVAGKTDFADWQVTIRDDSLNVAYTYIQNWKEKVYSLKTGASDKIAQTNVLSSTLGLATGYKKSAIVMLLTNSTTSKQTSELQTVATTRSYLLSGIWPKEVGAITLDYSTENIATFPVTFSVDYFEPYDLASVASNFLSELVKTVF